MSNKNTKKRRRVVMTSDVVPAGTRDHVLGADRSPEESAPSSELEASRPEGEASAAVEPAAVQVEGPIAGQMLVQVTPERRRRLASKSKPPPARAEEEENPATMAAAERASADDPTEDDDEADVERDEDVAVAERDEASAGARDDSEETSESDEERARGTDDGAADDATTGDAITEEAILAASDRCSSTSPATPSSSPSRVRW